MKILALYKYYWPDTTPYARILKAMLEHWVDQGHEAEVITAQPGYNDMVHPEQPQQEMLGGVKVRRVPIVREVKASKVRRMLSFLSFLGQAVRLACTGPKADVIIVNPHPPILMGLAVRLIRCLRGIPYIYHCEDIHPESARCMGEVAPGPMYRFLRSVDTGNCRNAGLIVTLSDDMADTLQERGLPGDGIEVINNFILAGDESGQPRTPVLPSVMELRDDDFVLVFGGNIGRFQGLDHFIHTARLLRDRPEIKFLFMGEGAAKADLMTMAGDLLDQTVFFCPYQPMPVAKQAMVEADMALVSLGPGVYKVAYPSKTMNCLAAGCPVLAIVETGSALARDIGDNELGFCSRQGDHEGTAQAIRQISDNRQDWRARRPVIAAWAEANFGQQFILNRWNGIPGRAVTTGGRP